MSFKIDKNSAESVSDKKQNGASGSEKKQKDDRKVEVGNLGKVLFLATSTVSTATHTFILNV